MYCRHCGKQISEESKYCGFCGGEQYVNVSTNNINTKAILCFFVSVLTDIMVIVGSFMKLISIEPNDMSLNYLMQKNVSHGLSDILDTADVLQDFATISDSFEKYSDYLHLCAYTIIAGVIICAIYLICYLLQYSYNGLETSNYVFGKDFRKFSCIPSLIMALLMIALNMICSNSLADCKDYVRVSPSIGTVIIIVCIIIHFVVSYISMDSRSNSTIISKAGNRKSNVANKKAWVCDYCGTSNPRERIRCLKCNREPFV